MLIIIIIGEKKRVVQGRNCCTIYITKGRGMCEERVQTTQQEQQHNNNNNNNKRALV